MIDIKIICEFCSKCFSKDFALQMHLMTGKKHGSLCYHYYVQKYGSEHQFPTRPFSKIKQGNNSICCERCTKNYRNMSQHFNYSNDCYMYYLNKYGEHENFPLGIFKDTGKCKDCGGKTCHSNVKYCKQCIGSHLPQTIDENLKNQISEKVKHQWAYNDEFKRKALEGSRYTQTIEFKKNQKQYMLDGGAIIALQGNKNFSKPQLEFYHLVKEMYDDAVLNYAISNLNVLLDIAIPSLKIDLEYDGSYWHQNIELDEIRDRKIKAEGWKIFRFRDRIPTKEELKNLFSKETNGKNSNSTV